jgi:hypothetical protein
MVSTTIGRKIGRAPNSASNYVHVPLEEAAIRQLNLTTDN